MDQPDREDIGHQGLGDLDDNEVTEAGAELKKILTDIETISLWLSLSEDFLDADEKDALRKLSNKLAKKTRAGDGGGTGGGPGPMARLIKLTQLTIPAYIQNILDQPQPSPIAVVDGMAAHSHRMKNLGQNISATDVFLSNYEYTLALTDRRGADQYCWLFSMWYWFDLVKTLRPEASGSRLGARMKRVLQDYVRQAFPNQPRQADDAANRMDDWSKYGKKIDLLGTEFGPGAIFVLGQYLDEPFLKDKFRESGQYYASMVEHVKGLGIVELTERTGANALAQSVRNFFIGGARG